MRSLRCQDDGDADGATVISSPMAKATVLVTMALLLLGTGSCSASRRAQGLSQSAPGQPAEPATVLSIDEALHGIPADWVEAFQGYRLSVPSPLPDHARALAQWIRTVEERPPTVRLASQRAETELRIFNLGDRSVDIQLVCLLDLDLVPCDEETSGAMLKVDGLDAGHAAQFQVAVRAAAGQRLSLVWHVSGDESLPTSPASDGAVLLVEGAPTALPPADAVPSVERSDAASCDLVSISTDPRDASQRRAFVGRGGSAWASYIACDEADGWPTRFIVWHDNVPLVPAHVSVFAASADRDPVIELDTAGPEVHVQVAIVSLRHDLNDIAGRVRWSNVVRFDDPPDSR